MELSEKLQELRKEKGLTQEELAEALLMFSPSGHKTLLLDLQP